MEVKITNVPEYQCDEAELKAIIEMHKAHNILRLKGWRDAAEAPEHSKLWLIEPGSTGFHNGFRDGRSFWVVDRIDTWPSRPILFKLQD